jgi:hypothetical protein
MDEEPDKQGDLASRWQKKMDKRLRIKYDRDFTGY